MNEHVVTLTEDGTTVDVSTPTCRATSFDFAYGFECSCGVRRPASSGIEAQLAAEDHVAEAARAAHRAEAALGPRRPGDDA